MVSEQNPTGWQSVRLGDLIQVKHGWPFKSKCFSVERAGRPIVVNIGNFKYTGGFRFESTTVKEYLGEYPREYELSPCDILLVMTCQTAGGEILGIPARIPDDGRVYLHNQRLGKVVVKQPPQVDSDYLYWLFLWPEFNRELAVTATGTKILHTAPTRIEQFHFPLPSLAEQKIIAHILGTFDDKIELNRRMNETLEAMARAIFKSWFVDFDPVRAKAAGRNPRLPKPIADLFPDSFVNSELGKIPKGWSTRPLYETADYVNGAAFRSEHFCDRSEGIPIVKIAELKNGITSQTNFSCRELDPKQSIGTGDLLYSWSGSPDTSLDVFLWTKGPGLLNQHIFKVHTRDAAQMYFVYYLLKHLRPTLIETARNKQTTGLGHVTVADMKRLRVTFPPEQVLAAFDEHIGPLFDRVFLNTLESDGLATLRDTLLPKLLSGKLRVVDRRREGSHE